jgi:hypothetical protein
LVNHRPSKEIVDPIERTEWDFTKLPSRYAETCFVYEAMRELARGDAEVMRRIAAWEKSRFKNRKALLASNRSWLECPAPLWDKFHSWFVEPSYVDFRFFPQVPFQALSEEYLFNVVTSRMGSEALKREFNQPFSILTFEEAGASKANITSREEYERWWQHWQGRNKDHVWVHAFVTFNRTSSRDQILEGLENWLKWNSGRKIFRNDGRATNRGGPQDQLRRLGALRIIKHYRTRKRITGASNGEEVTGPAPYKSYSNLFKAAKKARTFLEAIEQGNRAPL